MTESVDIDVWQLVEGKIVLKKITIDHPTASAYITGISNKIEVLDTLDTHSDDYILRVIKCEKSFYDDKVYPFLRLFIYYSVAGLLSPLYFKGKLVYSGNVPEDTNQAVNSESIEPFKDALPTDFLGEVFARVEGLDIAMKMNMTTKQGVTKLPDYYRYIQILPDVVCKMAIEDYSVSVSVKDRSTFMFVIRRAISIGEKVAEIIFDDFVERKIELPDEVLKLLMVERQFDKFLLKQLWRVGRFDIVETLYKDGVITQNEFDSASKSLYIPDTEKLPIGYEKIIDESCVDHFYTGRYSFLIHKEHYRFLILEKPLLFLDAAEKGLVENKQRIPVYSQTIATLPEDIKRRMIPFVEEDIFSNFLLKNAPIPDNYTIDQKLQIFIIDCGLDPRNYPNAFSTVYNIDHSPAAYLSRGYNRTTVEEFNTRYTNVVKVDDTLSYSITLLEKDDCNKFYNVHNFYGDYVYTTCHGDSTVHDHIPFEYKVEMITMMISKGLVKPFHSEDLLLILTGYRDVPCRDVLGYSSDLVKCIRDLINILTTDPGYDENDTWISPTCHNNFILTETGFLYLGASSK